MTAAPGAVAALMADAAAAGVPCLRLGETGGEDLTLAGEAPIGVADLRTAFESWFPAFMDGPRS